MCWHCDNPDRPRSDHLEHVRQLVDRYGWAVQAVERSGRSPGWAYTVGLTAFGEAELAVWGLPMEPAQQLLNRLAHHVVHHSRFEPGDGMEIGQGPQLEFVQVTRPWAHLAVAVDLYGPEIEALQAVWADDRDRWPWDVGFWAGRGGQPVLGPRGPVEARQLPPI